MKNKSAIFAAIALLIFSSCNKKITSAGTSPSPRKQKCKIEEVKFKYLTAKAKVNVTREDESTNFALNIRSKRDQVIWLSASMMGIEGLRCLVTQDSIFVKMNLPKKDFKSYSWDQLSKEYGTPLNFSLVQSVLIGTNAIQKSDSSSTRVDTTHCYLTQYTGPYTVTNQISLESAKLEFVNLEQASSDKTLDVDYDDYQKVGKFLFPFIAQATVREGTKESVVVDIKYKSANFTSNQLKFPFRVDGRTITP